MCSNLQSSIDNTLCLLITHLTTHNSIDMITVTDMFINSDNPYFIKGTGILYYNILNYPPFTCSPQSICKTIL